MVYTVQHNRLRPSPYPLYDKPLQMEGDALVIPDLEIPYHNSDFVNRLLDLAQTWKVTQCILAGDMLHFNSLSSWEPNWQQPIKKGGLDEMQEMDFRVFAETLPLKHRTRAYELLDKIGPKEEDGDPNVSEELRVARKTIRAMAHCFTNVDIVIGNHEGRLLRAMNTPLFPEEITIMVDRQDWRIAPYYYSELISNGEKFRIEHPKPYARNTAINLAGKFQCHILMAHSHLLCMDFDLSGRFYAIQMGHCADERRMCYAAQRSNTRPTHLNGAVIVRDGVPWLLHEKVDWNKLSKI